MNCDFAVKNLQNRIEIPPITIIHDEYREYTLVNTVNQLHNYVAITDLNSL